MKPPSPDLILSVEAARRIDEIAIRDYGISSLVLMENAARGAADLIEQHLTAKKRGPILIICGKGNNGGDGLAIARQLDSRGWEVHVDILARPEELSPDARANYDILHRAGFSLRSFCDDDPASTLQTWSQDWRHATLLIDAILGTGTIGEVREPYLSAITLINCAGPDITAIDLPSGLDAQSGLPASHCITAQHTITFVASKAGFATPAAAKKLGTVHIVNLGLPRRLLEDVLRNAE